MRPLRADRTRGPDAGPADGPRPPARARRRRTAAPPRRRGRVRRRRGHRPRAARRRAPRARRLARLSRRPHAMPAALVAARTTASARGAPRTGGRATPRGGAVSDDLRALFLRHVCQTSGAPLAIPVARAAGSTIWDTAGDAWLDLLAGMGVANVGHTHPDVVAAVRTQVERHLHVMVYGELVQAAQVGLA